METDIQADGHGAASGPASGRRPLEEIISYIYILILSVSVPSYRLRLTQTHTAAFDRGWSWQESMHFWLVGPRCKWQTHCHRPSSWFLSDQKAAFFGKSDDAHALLSQRHDSRTMWPIAASELLTTKRRLMSYICRANICLILPSITTSTTVFDHSIDYNEYTNRKQVLFHSISLLTAHPQIILVSAAQ